MTVRLGMITPSSNTCLEPITTAMLRQFEPDITAHFTRVRVTRIGLGKDELAQFDPEPMLAAARLLADSAVDVIAWNGTSGSWIGFESDRRLCQAIEKATGISATSATLAIADALRSYGVHRYGLAVPYTSDVAHRIVDQYRIEGFECELEQHLGISTNADFARVSDEQIEALVGSAAPRAEAVAVVCTNLAAAPLVAKLEGSLGIPVIDSIVATVWKSLDIAAPERRPAGWGDLASSGSLRFRVQPLLEDLLRVTGASRTTIRLDQPEMDLDVDSVAGEAVAAGVKSIRQDSSLDQWAMPTVKWIGEHHKVLVQNDFDIDGPPVSPALVSLYGVQAQMLGPIIVRNRMIGWISVHEVGRKRQWTDGEVRTLQSACSKVERIIEALAPHSAAATAH
jgi:maleate isomerase